MARYTKFSSRKLWFSVATSGMVFLSGLVAAYVAGFRSGLEIVVGGLLGVLGIYTGSSVGAKYVAGKMGQNPEDGEDTPKKATKKDKAEEAETESAEEMKARFAAKAKALSKKD